MHDKKSSIVLVGKFGNIEKDLMIESRKNRKKLDRHEKEQIFDNTQDAKCETEF
jgi:hypothetical protein